MRGEDKEEGRSGTHTRVDTGDVMADRAAWRVFSSRKTEKEEQTSASFVRFVKQKPARQWFSDAFYMAE